jgi:hypothetical protein
MFLRNVDGHQTTKSCNTEGRNNLQHT